MQNIHTDRMAHDLMQTYGLDTREHVMYDPHYTDFPVYRHFVFANWLDNSNILIKFDDTKLPSYGY